MTRREQAERASRARRDRARDLALLREALTRTNGRIYGTDRWIRRLVTQGLAEHPTYTDGHHGAGEAVASITWAGRAVIARADEETT